jgi:asparagine synthase (glutamine-hydrolysing)
MPGIVGLITKKPRREAEKEMLAMVDSIRHESFYGTGTWIDESTGVYVGWAVRKGCLSDGMPVKNESGDLVLVFSGEEFPEPGTAHRLKERGHSFDETGLSYLVHLCEENPDFLAALNGRFHGVLTDRTRGMTTLFNDRYGMHRIYYHESKDAVYFGAEAKAILTVRPELRRANLRGLGELVACGCVLEDRTIFEGIRLLPSASAWVFRNGRAERKTTYFQPREWEQQAPLDTGSFYQALRDTFSRNLPRYFNGKEQMGVALTGGLDTRVIMSWLKAPTKSLPCYTFGGTYRDCQDVILGRRIANVCEQPHTVITAGNEFLAHFPHYAERSLYLTDACVDISRSPDLYLSERAREIAPVKIVGTFGSELLRQVRLFKPVVPIDGLFRPELLSSIRQAVTTYTELIRGNPLTFVAFRQSPWYLSGVFALEETQLSVRSPYLDNDFVRTVFRAPMSATVSDDVRLQMIRDGNPALGRIRSDRGLGGGLGRLSGALSRGLLEFTFKAEYAYDYGMPQWVARIDHLFSSLQLEHFFLGRHKFAHFRVWYRDALSEYVRRILLDPRTLSRPYLERKGVEEVVRGHLKGSRNYTIEIHKLLTLELLHRLFLDLR